MRRLFKAFILVVFYFINFSQTKASHCLGGELTYRQVAVDSFVIRATFYKDCRGIDLSFDWVYVKGATDSFAVRMSLIECHDITPICPTGCSVCDPYNCNTNGYPSGSNPSCSSGYGVQSLIYEGGVNLSGAQDCILRMELLSGSRSMNTTTCCASGGYYNYALLNRCQKGFNSSGFFTSDPYMIMDISYPVCLSFQVMDTTSSDSISYELDSAMNDYHSLCTYSGNYTYKSPFSYSGFPKSYLAYPDGLHMDSITGDLCFRPSKQEISVIVVKATKWRKDSLGNYTLVSLIRRDMQLTFTNSGNALPKITIDDSLNFCAGVNICYSLKVTDADKKDTLELDYQTISKKITLNTISNNKIGINSELCWTPDVSLVRNEPYLLTLLVKDKNCPFIGKNYKTIKLFVKDTFPQITLKHADLGCGLVKFEAKANYSNGEKYTWEIPYPNGQIDSGTQVTRVLPSAMKYCAKLTVSNSICSVDYIDSVDVNNVLLVDLGKDTTICNEISIYPTITTKYPVTAYQWSHSSLGGSYIVNAADTLDHLDLSNLYTDMQVALIVSDSSGCYGTDTINLSSKLPELDLGPDTFSCNTYLVFANIKSQRNIQSYQWFVGYNKANLMLDSSVNGNTYLISDDSVPTYLALIITDDNGCRQTDTIKVMVNKLPEVDLGPDQWLCSGESLVLKPINSIAANSHYFWSDGSYGSTLTVNTAGTYWLKIIDHNGCSSIDRITVHSIPAVSPQLGADRTVCFGDSVRLISSSYLDYYAWYDENNKLIDTNSILSLMPTMNRTIMLKGQKVINGIICSGYDTVNIQVNPRPNANFKMTLDTFLLQGEFVPDDTGLVYYYWSIGNSFGSNHRKIIYAFPDTGWYTVKLLTKDSLGCSGSLSAALHVVRSQFTGLYLLNDQYQISMRPNPAKGSVQLVCQTELTEAGKIEWVNASGEVVYQQQIQLKPGTQTISMEPVLAKGVYLIRVITPNLQWSDKLIWE